MKLKPGDRVRSTFEDEVMEIKITVVDGVDWSGEITKIIKSDHWKVGQEIEDSNTKGLEIIKYEYKEREKITAKNKKRITFRIKKI